MMPLRTRTRRAFTVLELIVCISVVSMLFGLLFVAVERSRASARLIACKNTLRGVLSGLQNAEAANRCYPSFYNGYMKRTPSSPIVEILVHLERKEIAQNRMEGNEELYPPFSPLNDGLPLICADDPSTTGSSYRFSIGSSIYGDSRIIPAENTGNGAFSGLKRMRQSDFVDGLSNTIGISEHPIGTLGKNLLYIFPISVGNKTEFVVGNDEIQSDVVYEFGGQSVLFGTMRHLGYSHANPPNAKQSDFLFCDQMSPSSRCYAGLVSARSHHLNGVNVGVMDGSTRLISDTIDLGVWHSLGTRAEHDSVVLND